MNGGLVDNWVLSSSVLWTESDETKEKSIVDIFTEKRRDRHSASGGEILLLLV